MHGRNVCRARAAPKAPMSACGLLLRTVGVCYACAWPSVFLAASLPASQASRSERLQRVHFVPWRIGSGSWPLRRILQTKEVLQPNSSATSATFSKGLCSVVSSAIKKPSCVLCDLLACEKALSFTRGHSKARKGSVVFTENQTVYTETKRYLPFPSVQSFSSCALQHH